MNPGDFIQLLGTCFAAGAMLQTVALLARRGQP